VCISLVRIRYLKQAADFTYENVESSGWSMGELASGLTCACLPTLRPLFARCLPWMSTSPTGESYYYRERSGKSDRNRPCTKSDKTRGSDRSTVGMDTLVDNGEQVELGPTDDKVRAQNGRQGRWKVSRVHGQDAEAGRGVAVPVGDFFAPHALAGHHDCRNPSGGNEPVQPPLPRNKTAWMSDSFDDVGHKDGEVDSIGIAIPMPSLTPDSTSPINTTHLELDHHDDHDEMPLTPSPMAADGDKDNHDSRRWEVERRRADGRRWVQPAVRTQIVAPLASHPPDSRGIQVQRDVLVAQERARGW
jgi:hypothetical protein